MSSNKYRVGNNDHVEVFIGEILPGADENKRLGRYYVYIPNLLQFSNNNGKGKDNGILCRNRIHKNRISYLDDKKVSSYGQYFPLHPKTKVKVEFYNSDYNTGYIVEVISDNELYSMPPNNLYDSKEIDKKIISGEDRDNITTIFKTRNNCRLDIFESSVSNFKIFGPTDEHPEGEIKEGQHGDAIVLDYKNLSKYIRIVDTGIVIKADNLFIQGHTTIIGNVTIQGTLTVSGAVTLKDTLKIQGATTAQEDITGKITEAYHADKATSLG